MFESVIVGAVVIASIAVVGYIQIAIGRIEDDKRGFPRTRGRRRWRL